MLSTLKKQVHSRQKALIIAAFSLIFSACIALPWLFRHAISENARFENFAESLFEKEVSENVLNLHYSLANPEKQGISRPRASLGTLATDNSNAIRQYEQYEAKLKTFSPAKLSQTNRLTLDMLLLYYHTQASLGEHYLLEEPLGPSLGIQAQLPVLLAEYNFYNNQDITDYLNLLTTTGDYFQSILAFERAKSDAGFFMSDETLDRIQTQCLSFIQDPDSNYMLEIFSQKLKDYGKLSEKDQRLLNQAHRQILKEKVLPAYQRLIEGLEQLRGTGKTSGGLSNFSGGKEYYQYLLQSKVGIYLPVKQLEQRLTQQLSADSREISLLLKKYPDLFSQQSQNTDLPAMEPETIVNLLQEKIRQDFPETPAVGFEIRTVHKSMEEFLSPAFYLTPPMDTGSPNVIYINNGRSISNLELFTTLAHEGFPGHLYQTVYFARQNPAHIRYLIDSGGYVEGWATYVEGYAYRYAASLIYDIMKNSAAASSDNTSNSVPDRKLIQNATQLAWLSRSTNLCLYSLLDIGIHYEGWDQGRTTAFLKAFGINQESAVKEIYQYIVETPGNYLKYYWGSLNFQDLQTRCRKQLGDDFNLKEFHRRIMEIGPVQFPVLEKYLFLSYA